MTAPTDLGPHGAPLAAALGYVLGPQVGAFVAAHADVLLCSLVGGWWALSARETPGRLAGALYLLRVTLTAALLASFGAWLLAEQFNVPERFAPQLAALGLAAFADRLRAIAGAFIDRLSPAK